MGTNVIRAVNYVYSNSCFVCFTAHPPAAVFSGLRIKATGLLRLGLQDAAAILESSVAMETVSKRPKCLTLVTPYVLFAVSPHGLKC